jgi:peroxiredoxin Q/BCP
MIRTLIASVFLFSVTLVACGKSGDPAPAPAPAPAPEAAPTPAPAPTPEPTPTPEAAPTPAPEAATELAAGSPAPAVTFTLTDGSKVALNSLKGSRVLVYFYPKDDTPGCTVQAQGIRDRYEDLEAAGVKVFGVSTQDAASHEAFIDKYELPFPLVVDTDARVAKAFGVPLKNGFAMRQSFLIGADGKIAHVWSRVSPQSHVADVLDALN